MQGIKLVSKTRWNGGISHKRRYGSSTITEFWVVIDEELQPETSVGYGKTPGERVTNARDRYLISKQAP